MRTAPILLGAIVLVSCGPAVYGSTVCVEAGAKDGLMVYQPPNGKGVCMPPQAAIYITCLRDGLPGSARAGADAPPGSPSASVDGVRRTETRAEYSEVARLAAIDYCAKLAGISGPSRSTISAGPRE